jgi:hypothetical protein
MFFEIESAKSCVRNRVDWIYFYLLFERLCCVCVILLLLQRKSEIVVDVLVVWVQFNLLSECGARIIELP